MADFLDKVFKLKENNTNIQTEMIAGVTTFMTMAYIIIVNPAILSVPRPNGAGMDFNSVMVATCIAAAFATFFMGLYANYPFALAPGMGMNALFSFGICGTMGVPWEVTLGIVFLSGLFFVVLTFLRIREMVMDAIPDCIKYGTAAGIGVFIAFIGLKDAGVVISHPVTFVTLGNLSRPPTLLALVGLLLTAVLMARRVRGAIFWGLLFTGFAGIPLKIVEFTGVFSPIPSIAPTFVKIDILGALNIAYIPSVFIFLFFIMFDTIGTLIGVGEQGGFMVEGKLPRVNKALLSDATGAVVSSVFGTSPVTCYIESAAGVAEGGRTGLANMVTGTLFIIALFFSPITRMFGAGWHIPGIESSYLYPVTAPALIIVGSLMAQNIVKIRWQDFAEALPAFLTIIMMPLSFSISDGLAMGFISYPIIKLLGGRGREVHWLVYSLAVLFIARYVFLQ